MRVKATLTLTVVYDGARDLTEPKWQLASMVKHVTSQGLLCSGQTKMTVETWNDQLEAEEVKPEATKPGSEAKVKS